MSKRKISACELENVSDKRRTTRNSGRLVVDNELDEKSNDSDVQLLEVVQNSNHASKLYDNVHLNDREQLTNIHIYSFLRLLKREFPNINGLCPPDVSSIRAFANKPLANSIFIYNACGDHWVTISNVNVDDPDYWHIYDSYRYDNESFVDFFKLIYPNRCSVFIRKISVQRQRGKNDCGLFSLAYATSLCFGENPNDVQYIQKSFRKHFRNCLESNSVSNFESIHLNKVEKDNFKRRASQRAIFLELN